MSASISVAANLRPIGQKQLTLWRIFWIFPLAVFLLTRQIYTNLAGISRDLLTLLLLGGLAILGIAAFLLRLRERRRGFLMIDAITVTQFFVTAASVWAYSVTARIESSEAVSALFYYCLAPFLIYAGFVFFRYSKETRQAGLVAAGVAYLLTFWVAVYELLGIDSPLFQYDRWELQKNYSGIARASGLYGTQIDYGCLSFIAFSVAYFVGFSRPHWFAKVVAVVAALGALASMSRVWMLAIVLVLVIDLVARRTMKQRLLFALAATILLASLVPLLDDLGVMTMVTADDPYTQESNGSRIDNFSMMSEWVLHDYPIVGTGPGTQNGPDARNQKFVSDFLWLGFLIDFGSLTGSILVLLRFLLLVYMVARSVGSSADPCLRWLTSALCIAFFAASFVDSAFVHPVTVSLFYMISGIFLYSDSSQQPPSYLAAEAAK
jgi:hypothetical protein